MLLRYPRDSSCKLIDFGRSFFVAGAAELKERVSLLFVDRCSTVVRVVVTGASLEQRGSSGGSGNVKQHCNHCISHGLHACEIESERKRETQHAETPRMTLIQA